ncbi:hypothetical protein [Micromonospora craniellae]|uniref:hypothetical protein n=1 Tax=Micromonospora craniellae TaxID=2294034 RepID=UPI001CC53B6E|nr:hypothetical protein [Micromonospora craniellae]
MVRRTQNQRKQAALKVGGVGILAVALLGAGLTLASADDSAGPQTANCPTVRDKLSGVPAAAVNGVEQELANLDKQIEEANARLAAQAANPQGGANFIQNAILGPLASKRTAALDRIGININRAGGQRPNLASLATCGLNAPGAPSALNGGAGNGDIGAGNANNGGNNGNAGAGAAQTANCPTVRDKLSGVPAAAVNGVEQELANLDKQIEEANARLAAQAANPQGGANFIQNAILGPLASKRTAALDRIGININRAGGQRPNLASLATCGLNAPGAPSALNGGAGNGNAGNGGNNGNAGAGVAQRVNCPSVADRLPTVPAQAAAEVQRELANLDNQIADANARLAQLAVRPEGGPNFVQNTVVGPLKDRRVAALNRIATAIGRVDGNRPAELVNLAPCSVN